MIASLLSCLALALAAAREGSHEIEAYIRAHRAADAALLEGRAHEARRSFLRCLEIAPRQSAAAYGLACALALKGDPGQALEWLERAVELGYPDAALAAWDPDLQPLRGSERFERALQLMAAQAPPRPPPRKSDRLWRGEMAAIRDARAADEARCCAVDARSQLVALGMESGAIVLLDVREGRELARSPDLPAAVVRVAFQPNGAGLLALTADRALHVWRIDEPAVLHAARIPAEDPFARIGRATAFLQVSPSGDRVLAAAAGCGALLCTPDGKVLRSFAPWPGWCSDGTIAWSHDGGRFCRARGKVLELFDAADGALEGTFETPERILSAAFDPQGRWLATGHRDGRLHVWSLSDGALVHRRPEELDVFREVLRISGLAFAPAGDHLALSTTSGVEVVILETGSWRTVRRSGHLGGRMGEPGELRWSLEGERVWSAFGSGSLPLRVVEMAEQEVGTMLQRGPVPELSPGGLGALITWNGAAGLDASTGALLWIRPQLGRQGGLLHTAQGYFDTSLDVLEGLAILPPHEIDDDKALPLEEHALRLFDPKRVRAARAGVRLAHPTWPR